MTTTRILYDAQTNLGAQVAIATDRLQDSLAEMRRVRKILDAASAGDDWTALAAELGLVGPNAAAQAQALWSIFATAQERIDHAAVLELARLDQG